MYNAGHPVLDVEHHLENDTLYLTVEQKQDLSAYPLYFLPLYVDLYWGEETLTYPLSIADQVHTFRIPALGRSLKSIQFDPEFQLVGVVQHDRSYEELMHLALESEDVMSRTNAYHLLLELAKENELLDSTLVKMILQEENELVLVEYIDRLFQFGASNLKIHEESLSALSVHSHPQVRASALLLLDQIPGKVDWGEIYAADESNYVAGLALESVLAEGSKETNLILMDSLKQEKDLNLLLPLTLFINDSFSDGYSEWYKTIIGDLRSSDQLYMLSAYNDYLLDASQIEKLSARSFLLHYAKYHINTDTRLVAFEGLLLLADAISVDRQVGEVLAFERDKQLLALYQEFYPE